jgi:hypothetical protein
MYSTLVGLDFDFLLGNPTHIVAPVGFTLYFTSKNKELSREKLNSRLVQVTLSGRAISVKIDIAENSAVNVIINDPTYI